jgi:hypothetical protein
VLFLVFKDEPPRPLPAATAPAETARVSPTTPPAVAAPTPVASTATGTVTPTPPTTASAKGPGKSNGKTKPGKKVFDPKLDLRK